MKLSKFVQRDIASPIHSSGFVQGGARIGSTAVDPFSKRIQRDQSRQMIGGYRDSRVLQQARHDNRDNQPTSYRDASRPPASEANDALQLREQRRGSRIDIVRPTGAPAGNVGASRSQRSAGHTFKEPQSRHRP